MQTVTIIMYHYVRPIVGSKYPGIKGLELDLFRQQLDYVRKHFQVVTVEEVIDAVEGRGALPDHAMLLTFDDGYRDHYEYVFPLLKECHMQGSFYVPSAVLQYHKVLDVNKLHFILACSEIDKLMHRVFELLAEYRRDGYEIEPDEVLFAKLAKSNRWDPAEVIFIKRLLQSYLAEDIRTRIVASLFEEIMNESEEEFSRRLYVNMNEIREMKDEGMLFGLHGERHYWLDQLPEDQLRKDMEHSYEFFKDVIEPDYLVMNYPYGGYNEAVVAQAKRMGCKLGITVEAGVAHIGETDAMLFPRFDTNDFPPKSENWKSYC